MCADGQCEADPAWLDWETVAGDEFTVEEAKARWTAVSNAVCTHLLYYYYSYYHYF